jgi:hypothetical protein
VGNVLVFVFRLDMRLGLELGLERDRERETERERKKEGRRYLVHQESTSQEDLVCFFENIHEREREREREREGGIYICIYI